MGKAPMWTLLAVGLVLAAAGAWALSRLSFTPVRAYLDAQASDGEVETYDRAFHARVLRNLRWLSAAFAGAGVLLFAARKRMPTAPKDPAGAWGAFRADVGRVIGEAVKRSSRMHLLLVLAIMLVGTALRLVHLWDPITYDEAFTYVQYASKPYHILLSDYSYPNNHVLHTALARLSTELFGVHRWSLRLPALLAGVLVMPLFYLFVRAMFNRYIALIALAFVASSGGLIEYSALARGYSLTWLFYVLALLLGRHLAKTNNWVSAVLTGLSCALGMWAVPTMIYALIAIHAWLLFYLLGAYRHTVGERLSMVLLSFGVSLVLTSLFYLPVITVHGAAQLVHHPTMGDNTWSAFVQTHQDRALDLWVYLTDTAMPWISLLGLAGIVYAAYISSKYRALLLALLVGAVPMTIVQCMVAPPRVWLYLLFMLHLSSAIGIFYLLKFVQEKVWPSLAKRARSAVAAMVVLLGMGFLGMRGIADRMERYPEAILAADWFPGILKPEDRILVDFPWEAPVEFEFLARGLGREPLFRPITAGTTIYVLVSPADGQTPQSVETHYGHEGITVGELDKLQDWRRLEVYRDR
ncbi:MAG: glycosyltransferase family 39 protein [Flavobacteriales bacterium]|nr:glycosyltransferase family 39 protein [Flavobacteriales bacterium]